MSEYNGSAPSFSLYPAGKWLVGGNKGSTMSSNAWSTTDGTILPMTGLSQSNEGLVLTPVRIAFPSLFNKKSRPTN